MTNKVSRRVSLLTDTILSLLSWFLPIITGLIATPVIVKSLGRVEYGLYASLIGFISYSIPFGIGKILVKYVAEYRASGEDKRLSESISSTIWLSLGLTITGCTVVVLSAGYIVQSVLALPEEQFSIGRNGIYLASATILAMMVSQIFQFILQGLHRFRPYLLITNLSGILLNVGNVGLALTGAGVEALLWWNLTSILIMGGVFAATALPGLPEFSIRPYFRSREWPFVMRYAASIVVYQVFGNILFIFERAWIIRRFGTESATYYLIPMTLAIYLHSIATSSILVVFPLVNELLHDRERLEMLYIKANKMIVAFISFMAVVLIFGGDGVLELWVGAEIAKNSYHLLIIHTLTFAFTASLMIIGMIAEGFRFPYFNSILTVTWVIVVIPLIIFVVDPWGLEGVAGARLFGVVLTLPLLFVFERIYLGRVLWRFWSATLGRLLIAGAAAAAVLVGIDASVFGLRWYSIALRLALGIGTFLLVVAVSGYFSKEERQMLLELVYRRKASQE